VHALATLLALLLAGTASQRAGRRLVQRVMPGSSAERCGLRPGDFILAIASQPVQTYRQLYRVLWRSGPAGTRFTLTVLQDGEVRSIDIDSTGAGWYYGPR
jgi:S1-C subfamily serine protease